MFEKINKYFRINTIFLIDGIGALVSTLFLFLFIRFEHLVGMPKESLQYLILITSCFTIYSFICHFIKITEKNFYLKIIAIANLLYCIISLAFFILYFDVLTILGIIYFLFEKIIVFNLSFIEWRLAKESK